MKCIMFTSAAVVLNLEASTFVRSVKENSFGTGVCSKLVDIEVLSPVTTLCTMSSSCHPAGRWNPEVRAPTSEMASFVTYHFIE